MSQNALWCIYHCFFFVLTVFLILELFYRGRLLVGTVSAFMVHLVLTSCINNRAMNHVVDASTSSWLQEHMTDMSERLERFFIDFIGLIVW